MEQTARYTNYKLFKVECCFAPDTGGQRVGRAQLSCGRLWKVHISRFSISENPFPPSWEVCWADAGSKATGLTPRIGKTLWIMTASQTPKNPVTTSKLPHNPLLTTSFSLQSVLGWTVPTGGWSLSYQRAGVWSLPSSIFYPGNHSPPYSFQFPCSRIKIFNWKPSKGWKYFFNLPTTVNC